MPSGATNAFIVENEGPEVALGGSATLGVYVVPAGHQVEDLAGADKAGEIRSIARAPRLRWRGDRLLEIGYGPATVEGFDNRHDVTEGRSERSTIELRPIPTEHEPAPGG